MPVFRKGTAGYPDVLSVVHPTSATPQFRRLAMLSAAQPAFWHSISAMNSFTLWGIRELAVHNDAEISAAMMVIARRRGDNRVRVLLSKKAGRVFVSDPRFGEPL